MSQQTNKSRGDASENRAAEHLISLGHQILQRNFRYGRLEADIVSRFENILVFTEVKSRKSNNHGEPEEYVSEKKIERYMQIAEYYVLSQDWEGEVRFDVVAITDQGNHRKLKHIEGAF